MVRMVVRTAQQYVNQQKDRRLVKTQGGCAGLYGTAVSCSAFFVQIEEAATTKGIITPVIRHGHCEHEIAIPLFVRGALSVLETRLQQHP